MTAAAPTSMDRSPAGRAALLLLALTALIYGNSLECGWHLDDYDNIVDNPAIHLERLTPAAVADTFFSQPDRVGQRLYRPVACLSFALNWYTGGDRLPGFHLVNILIHALVAWVLYLTAVQVLRTPRLTERWSPHAHDAALLAAALWAAHPLHTQAVTYVVQRMAQLGALFYLLGIWAYLRGRAARAWDGMPLGWGLAVGLIYLLALGSRENTVTLPLALVLVEVLGNRPAAEGGARRTILPAVLVASAAVALLAAGAFWLFKGNPLAWLEHLYAAHSFSFAERVLSQPRVLWFHLSQLAFPTLARLSIEHDVTVSASLWRPWTTPLAIAGLAALSALAVGLRRRCPLVSLAVGFFLLAHVVESSVLPLALIFEHRNYLPAAFVFLPPAAWCVRGIASPTAAGRPLRAVTIGLVAVALMVLGTTTHLRNTVWRTEQRLWEDAAAKAPGRIRPLINLAVRHHEPRGQWEQARRLYEAALTRRDSVERYYRAVALSNLGTLLGRRGETDRALAHYDEALALSPHFSDALRNTALVLMRAGRWTAAADHLERVLRKRPHSLHYLNLRGLVEMNRGAPAAALVWFKRAWIRRPTDGHTLLNLGVAFGRTGHPRRADLFLQRARRRLPRDPYVHLALVENAARSGGRLDPAGYAREVVARMPVPVVWATLDAPSADTRFIPFEAGLIRGPVEEALAALGK